MNEIKLSVNDKNLEIVQTILNNLKDGIISKMEINGKSKARTTHYQPKINTLIKEEDSATNDSSGKYASATTYKQRLKRK